MSTQLILLERVEKLGTMGDVVNVKPGYARNFLLPQKKALRATKQNLAYFEAQKKQFEADNDKRRKEAEKNAKAIEGLKVALIRQASEAGQLFGSVTSRDIATELSSASGQTIDRSAVDLNQNYKTIGLFPVSIVLHPEVRVEVTLNIARSTEEAQIQAETGKALIADDAEPEASVEEIVDAEEEAAAAEAEEAQAEAPEADTAEEEAA